MILVGLTGGIGSGKSTVSSMLAARGAEIIDADDITREVQQPGSAVVEAIAARFGDNVIDAERGLIRAKLADVVFAFVERDEKYDNHAPGFERTGDPFAGSVFTYA